MRGLKQSYDWGLSIAIMVAPYVGAWIETDRVIIGAQGFESHPTWVRGLKLRFETVPVTINMSHPTWVRGLKPATEKTIK